MIDQLSRDISKQPTGPLGKAVSSLGFEQLLIHADEGYLRTVVGSMVSDLMGAVGP
jgi:hypothetical protein